MMTPFQTRLSEITFTQLRLTLSTCYVANSHVSPIRNILGLFPASRRYPGSLLPILAYFLYSCHVPVSFRRDGGLGDGLGPASTTLLLRHTRLAGLYFYFSPLLWLSHAAVCNHDLARKLPARLFVSYLFLFPFRLSAPTLFSRRRLCPFLLPGKGRFHFIRMGTRDFQ